MDYQQLIIEMSKILIPFILGMILMFILYRLPNTRRIKFISKLFSIEAEKFRDIIKNDFNITKLEIIDSNGKTIKKPFPLKEGNNSFKCVATYTDGTKESYAPYWLCWGMRSQDSTGIFGSSKRESVDINCHKNHERYTELSCWVFTPDKVKPNVHIPHDSTGFVYPY